MGQDLENKKHFGLMLVSGSFLMLKLKRANLSKILEPRSYGAFNLETEMDIQAGGTAIIAINEWLSQYNTRMAHVYARAGVETQIRITPTYHSASKNIRSLSPKERQCKFSDEIEVH